MAIQIKNTYSGRTDNTDPNYPYGKGRNVVGGVEGTGTPFEADWYNNLEGFLQGLLLEAGVTPDGEVDNANSSQLVEAVKGLGKSASKVITSDGRNVQERLDDLPSEVDAAGTAATLIEDHNSDAEAHPELSAFITSEASRAETAADAATLSGNIYADTAAGLTATVDGDYFSVVSPDVNGYLDLYKNESGSAVYQKTYPSSESIAEVTLSQRDKADSQYLIDKSLNIYNYKTDTIGFYINAFGDLVENEGSSVTSFIEVLPNETLTISGSGTLFIAVAEYDIHKRFIRFQNTFGQSPKSFSVGENTYFIRLNNATITTDGTIKMLSKGDAVPEYEPFGVKVKGDALPLIPDDKINPISGSKIIENTITTKQVEFVKTNHNLYDPKRAKSGYIVGPYGNVIENSGYSITEVIQVKPNTSYSKVGEGTIFNTIALYDSEMKFNRRLDFIDATITTGDNDYHAILSFRGSVFAERMFYEGSTPLPYVEKRYFLDNIELYENPPRLADSYMIDTQVTGVFSTTENYDYAPEFRYITASGVYQLYDDLVTAFPDYITKQVLGNDLFGNEISVYKFIPQRPDSQKSSKKIRAFITAGTHGYEHIPGMSTYLAIKDICERWESDESLELIRHNIDLLIIPVTNPSGWDDYTRENRNGVDINRNFPIGWDEANTGAYKGPSPLSELESQYIAQVFDENPDITMFYDYHNFAGSENTDYFIWIPSDSVVVEHMASNLIQRMTRKWRKDYAWIPRGPNWFAGYSDSTHGAMIQDYAYSLGIEYSAVIETGGRWWISTDPTSQSVEHKRTSVETLINWLLINVEQIIK